MKTTPVVTKHGILQICSKIGENKTSDLDSIPTMALKFPEKPKPDATDVVFAAIAHTTVKHHVQ